METVLVWTLDIKQLTHSGENGDTTGRDIDVNQLTRSSENGNVTGLDTDVSYS